MQEVPRAALDMPVFLQIVESVVYKLVCGPSYKPDPAVSCSCPKHGSHQTIP